MIVIGCGKAKLDRRVPARELYTGSLFVASRRYAEASGQLWAILSAKHGLVLPDQELAPYDVTFRVWGRALELWAARAAERCERLIESTGAYERVEVLAGRLYAEPFRDSLLGLGIESTAPLEGLELGYRLRWLKEHMPR